MSISLTIRYSRQEIIEHRQSYDLRIEVTNATDMPAKIFIFQRTVMSAMDDEANREVNQFISIADPVDLEEFPEDSPDLDNSMPYFRTDVVELRFRSMVELEDTKILIDEDITGLIAALKAAQDVVVMEDKTYA